MYIGISNLSWKNVYSFSSYVNYRITKRNNCCETKVRSVEKTYQILSAYFWRIRLMLLNSSDTRWLIDNVGGLLKILSTLWNSLFGIVLNWISIHFSLHLLLILPLWFLLNFFSVLDFNAGEWQDYKNFKVI